MSSKFEVVRATYSDDELVDLLILMMFYRVFARRVGKKKQKAGCAGCFRFSRKISRPCHFLIFLANVNCFRDSRCFALIQTEGC